MKISRGIIFNRHLPTLAIATIIFTGLIGISLVSDSFAMKAQGKSVWKYGSATSHIVCGDRLCSEIPDGKAGYTSMMKSPVQDTKPKATCMEDEILIKGAQCAPYEVSGTFVTGAYVDEKSNSIVIGTDPYNGGTLVIDLSPRIVSDMFMILIDGQEWRDSYIDGNRVTVNFPWATEKIEIIGEKLGN